jgi:hypothetical protein
MIRGVLLFIFLKYIRALNIESENCVKGVDKKRHRDAIVTCIKTNTLNVPTYVVVVVHLW